MASSMYFVPTTSNNHHSIHHTQQPMIMNNLTQQLSTPTTTATPSTFHGGSRGGSSGFGGVREWVKLVGLPYTASEKDVREFLCDYCIPEKDSVFFVVSAGKPCGRAYVHLSNADEAARAARELNKQYLGSRYIDVRQIALREVQRELREVACRQESINYDSESMPVGVDRSIRNPVPFLPQQRAGNCVKLVGLPFTCTEQQISEFMEGVRIRPGGVHFMTRNGKPSGNCVVELEDPLEAYKAVTRGHKKYLGRRFIEVYLARPCDLFCDADELKSSVRLHPLPDTVTNEELANTLYGLGLPAPTSMTLMPGQSNVAGVEAYLVYDDEETAGTVMVALTQQLTHIEKITLCTALAYKSAMSKRHPIQHNSPAPTPDTSFSPMMAHMNDHHSHSAGFSITSVPFSFRSHSDTSSDDATRPPSPMNDGEGKHEGGHHVVFTHDPYSLERFASTESESYLMCDGYEGEYYEGTTTPYSMMAATTCAPPQPQAQLLHSMITSCF